MEHADGHRIVCCTRKRYKMFRILWSTMRTLCNDMSTDLRMSLGFTLSAHQYCVTLVVGRGHGRLRGLMQSVEE